MNFSTIVVSAYFVKAILSNVKTIGTDNILVPQHGIKSGDF
jgi:hypothetical protein